MNTKSIIESYKSLYKGMNFERIGLFQLMRDTYSCKEVLYPGCSIHITPSFVFPHMAYVDKSTEAKRFFEEHQEVLDFVTKNRTYKRKPFIQFIHQDYSTPLPLQEESFDLLLSFFAGAVAPACRRYLRQGGLLVTNSLKRVETGPGWELIAMISFQGGKYQFVSEAAIPAKERAKKYLRQSTRGLEYVESESYFVFKKRS